MLKKKSGLTYCDVRERYEHFRSRCTEEKPIIATFTKAEKKEGEKGCTEAQCRLILNALRNGN
jgi:hypothetical protein